MSINEEGSGPGLRLDHLVIATRDLEEAGRLYRALGFEVHPGGRHTGRGTHNALVRFHLDYLELISVYDEAEAERAGRGPLVRFLREHGGGPVAYALASDDLDALAERLRALGFPFQGPFPMERLRPDGRRLTWRLLVPLPSQYRQRWPFFIRWDLPDEERLALEGVGHHPNGATGVAEVAVAVRDLEEASEGFARALDLTPLGEEPAPDLGAVGLAFALERCRLLLLAPTGPGPVSEALARWGEGPLSCTLRVAHPETARRWLEAHGLRPEVTPRGLRVPSLPPEGACLLFRDV